MSPYACDLLDFASRLLVPHDLQAIAFSDSCVVQIPLPDELTWMAFLVTHIKPKKLTSVYGTVKVGV